MVERTVYLTLKTIIVTALILMMLMLIAAHVLKMLMMQIVNVTEIHRHKPVPLTVRERIVVRVEVFVILMILKPFVQKITTGSLVVKVTQMGVVRKLTN